MLENCLFISLNENERSFPSFPKDIGPFIGDNYIFLGVQESNGSFVTRLKEYMGDEYWDVTPTIIEEFTPLRNVVSGIASPFRKKNAHLYVFQKSTEKTTMEWSMKNCTLDCGFDTATCLFKSAQILVGITNDLPIVVINTHLYYTYIPPGKKDHGYPKRIRQLFLILQAADAFVLEKTGKRLHESCVVLMGDLNFRIPGLRDMSSEQLQKVVDVDMPGITLFEDQFQMFRIPSNVPKDIKTVFKGLRWDFIKNWKTKVGLTCKIKKHQKEIQFDSSGKTWWGRQGHLTKAQCDKILCYVPGTSFPESDAGTFRIVGTDHLMVFRRFLNTLTNVTKNQSQLQGTDNVTDNLTDNLTANVVPEKWVGIVLLILLMI